MFSLLREGVHYQVIVKRGKCNSYFDEYEAV